MATLEQTNGIARSDANQPAQEQAQDKSFGVKRSDAGSPTQSQFLSDTPVEDLAKSLAEGDMQIAAATQKPAKSLNDLKPPKAIDQSENFDFETSTGEEGLIVSSGGGLIGKLVGEKLRLVSPQGAQNSKHRVAFKKEGVYYSAGGGRGIEKIYNPEVRRGNVSYEQEYEKTNANQVGNSTGKEGMIASYQNPSGLLDVAAKDHQVFSKPDAIMYGQGAFVESGELYTVDGSTIKRERFMNLYQPARSEEPVEQVAAVTSPEAKTKQSTGASAATPENRTEQSKKPTQAQVDALVNNATLDELKKADPNIVIGVDARSRIRESDNAVRVITNNGQMVKDAEKMIQDLIEQDSSLQGKVAHLMKDGEFKVDGQFSKTDAQIVQIVQTHLGCEKKEGIIGCETFKKVQERTTQIAAQVKEKANQVASAQQALEAEVEKVAGEARYATIQGSAKRVVTALEGIGFAKSSKEAALSAVYEEYARAEEALGDGAGLLVAETAQKMMGIQEHTKAMSSIYKAFPNARMTVNGLLDRSEQGASSPEFLANQRKIHSPSSMLFAQHGSGDLSVSVTMPQNYDFLRDGQSLTPEEFKKLCLRRAQANLEAQVIEANTKVVDAQTDNNYARGAQYDSKTEEVESYHYNKTGQKIAPYTEPVRAASHKVGRAADEAVTFIPKRKLARKRVEADIEEEKGRAYKAGRQERRDKERKQKSERRDQARAERDAHKRKMEIAKLEEKKKENERRHAEKLAKAKNSGRNSKKGSKRRGGGTTQEERVAARESRRQARRNKKTA